MISCRTIRLAKPHPVILIKTQGSNCKSCSGFVCMQRTGEYEVSRQEDAHEPGQADSNCGQAIENLHLRMRCILRAMKRKFGIEENGDQTRVKGSALK